MGPKANIGTVKRCGWRGRSLTDAAKTCEPQEGPEVDSLRGPVTPAVLAQDQAAAEAEAAGLLAGQVAYHYFEGETGGGDLPLWRIIYMERSVGSYARCLTVDQIRSSVQAASLEHRPHYGDGAYCTLHADYQNAHPVVVVAHGKPPELNTYRAVLRLEAPERFRKFACTGGVVRSIPRETTLRSEQLVKMGEATGEARLLRIERYVNADGRWAPVSLPSGG